MLAQDARSSLVPHLPCRSSGRTGCENGRIGGRDSRYWLSLRFSPLQIAPEALNETERGHCYYNFIEA